MKNPVFDIIGKRIYVAGHSGLVGSAVAGALQNYDCEILTATRNDLDLTRQADVEAWFSANTPDAVILCAAKVGGIVANRDNPAAFITENLQMQTHIIDAAYRAGVGHLVFLGSSCVYPKNAPVPIVENALLSAPLEETNEAYAIAKIAGIKMCDAYARQYGVRYFSVMPCNLYGVGDRFDLENSHVIPALMMKAHDAKVSGGDFVVWGDGSPLREFLYADDAAAGIVACLQNYDEGGIINLGADTEISINELAKMIADVVGFKGKIIFDTDRPDGVYSKRIDSSRMGNLGWRPQTDLCSGLEKTYAWYLKNVA